MTLFKNFGVDSIILFIQALRPGGSELDLGVAERAPALTLLGSGDSYTQDYQANRDCYGDGCDDHDEP